jgi:hypothetical protein
LPIIHAHEARTVICGKRTGFFGGKKSRPQAGDLRTTVCFLI